MNRAHKGTFGNVSEFHVHSCRILLSFIVPRTPILVVQNQTLQEVTAVTLPR